MWQCRLGALGAGTPAAAMPRLPCDVASAVHAAMAAESGVWLSNALGFEAHLRPSRLRLVLDAAALTMTAEHVAMVAATLSTQLGRHSSAAPASSASAHATDAAEASAAESATARASPRASATEGDAAATSPASASMPSRVKPGSFRCTFRCKRFSIQLCKTLSTSASNGGGGGGSGGSSVARPEGSPSVASPSPPSVLSPPSPLLLLVFERPAIRLQAGDGVLAIRGIQALCWPHTGGPASATQPAAAASLLVLSIPAFQPRPLSDDPRDFHPSPQTAVASSSLRGFQRGSVELDGAVDVPSALQVSWCSPSSTAERDPNGTIVRVEPVAMCVDSAVVLALVLFVRGASDHFQGVVSRHAALLRRAAAATRASELGGRREGSAAAAAAAALDSELTVAAEVAAATDAAAAADAAVGAYATPSDAAAAAAAAVAASAAAAAVTQTLSGDDPPSQSPSVGPVRPSLGPSSPLSPDVGPASPPTPPSITFAGGGGGGAREEAAGAGESSPCLDHREIRPLPSPPPPAAKPSTALHLHLSEASLTFAEQLMPACDPLHLGAGPRLATLAAGRSALVLSGAALAMSREPAEPSAALYSTQQRSAITIGRLACELIHAADAADEGTTPPSHPSALPSSTLPEPTIQLPILLPGRVAMSLERHHWHGLASPRACTFLEVTAPSVALSFSPDHLREVSAVVRAVRSSIPPSAPPPSTTRPAQEADGGEEEVEVGEGVGEEKEAAEAQADDRDGACAASEDDLRADGAFVPLALPGGRAGALTIAHSPPAAVCSEAWVSWRYPLPRTVTSVSIAGVDKDGQIELHQQPSGRLILTVSGGGGSSRSRRGGSNDSVVCELSQWDLARDRFVIVATSRMGCTRSGCDLIPDLGGGVGGRVPGAWEWRLTIRLEGRIGPFRSYTSTLDGGLSLLPRLLVHSTDAAADVPPLLVHAELPGVEFTVNTAAEESNAAADAPGGGDGAGASSSAPNAASAASASGAGFSAATAPRSVLTPPAELIHLSLRSARVRWVGLGARHGWRLRVRSRLAYAPIHYLNAAP